MASSVVIGTLPLVSAGLSFGIKALQLGAEQLQQHLDVFLRRRAGVAPASAGKKAADDLHPVAGLEFASGKLARAPGSRR